MLGSRTLARIDAEVPGPMSNPTFCFALSDPPRLVSVRGGTEALLGYSQRDLLTAKVSLRDLIHPEDAGVAGCIFSPDLQKPRGVINIRLRHADGRIRCFKGTFAKKRDGAAGEALLDLTIEDARAVREPGDSILVTSFKSLIAQTGDLIYIKNRNHVILAASRAAPKFTESAKGRTELAGKTNYDLFPEDVADLAYRLENRAMAEGRRVNELLQLQVQDGSKRWVDIRVYPINGPDGEIIGIFGIAPDITEFIEARSKLRESEESLLEAQKIAGLGSYLLDIDTGLWTSSDVMDRIFGIDKEYERTVEGWAALIHPDDRSPMVAYFKNEVLGQVKPFDREYRVIRQTDGAVRWVHGLGRLEFDVQGRPVKMPGTIQDITEARQAQEALRESKDLLQLFIEHAPVALAMLDREMRYLAVSRRWREIHDLNGRELIGHSHYEFFPNIPESWKALHGRVLAGEVIPPGEISLQRPDGSLQWLHREIRPWFAGDGQVGGIIIFSEDITERKRTETEVRESKELLQIFIQHAPVALAMFDREMRYVAVSRRWLEEYGLVGREMIGRSHYEVIPDIPERWKEAHRRGLAGESQRAEEDRFDRADGTVQWIRWEVIPWRAGDGSVGGIVLFAEDITLRKEAEERLRLAATVFTGAREGITITDRSGTILEVNDAFTRITGYTREEVLGRNPRLLQSGLQSKEFYENMWESLVREGHWSGEIWNRTKSGDIYAEMLTINAIRDANGDVQQYVGLFTDITEIKEHEQQLEHITHYDALTGLPNRALLADRLRQAMAHAHRKQAVAGRGLLRRRWVQGHQRPLWPRDRRRAADGPGLQDEARPAGRRYAGPAGRRRVCRRDPGSGRH